MGTRTVGLGQLRKISPSRLLQEIFLEFSGFCSEDGQLKGVIHLKKATSQSLMISSEKPVINKYAHKAIRHDSNHWIVLINHHLI